MDVVKYLIDKEPKVESEDGESVFESLMNDDTDSDKKETDGITAERKKPSLRRSVRKSAVTTKSNGTLENNDVSSRFMGFINLHFNICF